MHDEEVARAAASGGAPAEKPFGFSVKQGTAFAASPVFIRLSATG
jgi:hypothetical protein